MADSYILHDVVRKVKADGLFDSIRRDLILDIEQKVSLTISVLNFCQPNNFLFITFSLNM